MITLPIASISHSASTNAFRDLTRHMISQSQKDRMALIRSPAVLAWAIAVWFVCASCSGRAEKDRTGNQASPTVPDQASTPRSSPSPSPTVAPLRTPERVASGRVTESRGTWNSMVDLPLAEPPLTKPREKRNDSN